MSDQPALDPIPDNESADASPVEQTLTYSQVEEMINAMELDFKCRSLALQIASKLAEKNELPTADSLLEDAKKIDSYLRTGK